MTTMKALEYITNKEQRTIWLRAFRIWQRRPHEVAPITNVTHTCSSCSTEFTGNFCPRCGQSAIVGRFSFKKAFLLFIDVWGLGNRGMFRSIRDLMLRPGYMIRDYLKGMQSAYFPPFKMFFLMMALSLLVEHGFSFGLDEAETEDAKKEAIKNEVKDAVKDEYRSGTFVINGNEKEVPALKATMTFAKMMNILREKNPAIFAFLTLIIFSLPLFIFFRSTPTIPDLRYSEFIVALVYTANTYSIYSIAGKLLNSGLLKFIAVLMVFVALKQFSGYKKRKLFGYIIIASILALILFIVLSALTFSIAYLMNKI